MSRTRERFRTSLQDEEFRKKHGLVSEEASFATQSMLYFVAGDPGVAEDLSKKGILVFKDATVLLPDHLRSSPFR